MKRVIYATIICALAAFWLVAAQGQQPQEYLLRYTPQPGLADEGMLKVKVVDVTYQGTPMGVSATAGATYKIKVGAVENDIASVNIAVSNTQVTSGEGTWNIANPPALTVKVNPLGFFVGGQFNGQVVMGQIDAGAIPLQLLTALMATGRFPDEPVEVSAKWEMKDSYDIPNVGRMVVRTQSTLEAVEGSTAVVKSRIEILVPDFSGPNPLLQDELIPYTDGHIVIAKLVRLYDMNRSAVLSARGQMEMTFTAVFPDTPAPMGVTGDFELRSASLPKPGSE